MCIYIYSMCVYIIIYIYIFYVYIYVYVYRSSSSSSSSSSSKKSPRRDCASAVLLRLISSTMGSFGHVRGKKNVGNATEKGWEIWEEAGKMWEKIGKKTGMWETGEKKVKGGTKEKICRRKPR